MKWKHLAAGTAMAIACVLSGCAPVHRATRGESEQAKTFAPLTDKAVVYIYRNTMFGAAISLGVDVDNVRVGSTGAYSFFKLALDPGKHTIVSHGENVSTVEIDAKAGENYFVWQDLGIGFVEPRTKLKLMSASEGQKQIKSLKLLQPDTAQFRMPAASTPAPSPEVASPATPVVTPAVASEVPRAPTETSNEPAPQAAEPMPSREMGTIAATDPRVGKPMFVAAQDLSSAHHCERLLRVRSIDGDDAHFYASCPSGGAPIEIHCNGTSCHEAAPQG